MLKSIDRASCVSFGLNVNKNSSLLLMIKIS